MSADNNTMAIKLVLIGIAVIILIVLIMQYNAKQKTVVQEESPRVRARERFTDQVTTTSQPPVPSQSMTAQAAPVTTSSNKDADAVNVVKPSEPLANEDYKAVDFEVENKLPTDCFPRDKITADDLLPKDVANSKWAQVAPAGQGELKDQNYLNSGFHIGVNTVGQSLRNANYQLRSDPPNPKVAVGPWNQSTIEYDNSRRFFEINEC